MIDILISTPMPISTGFFDWANGLAAQGKQTLAAVASLAIVVVVTVLTIKGGFTLGKLIVNGVVGAIALWLIVGQGLNWGQKTLDETVTDSSSSIVRVIPQDTDAVGLHV